MHISSSSSIELLSRDGFAISIMVFVEFEGDFCHLRFDIDFVESFDGPEESFAVGELDVLEAIFDRVIFDDQVLIDDFEETDDDWLNVLLVYLGESREDDVLDGTYDVL